jgi:ABC-type multidrug transport system permease subunit
VLGALTVVLVFGVGALFFGVRIGFPALLGTALAFTAIIASMTALGLLLVSLVDSPQSVTAIALATLLPLSMVSDIFINSPSLPTVMSALGWTFPLRHMAAVAVSVSSGQAVDLVLWGHLGVILLWGLVAAVVAARLFRWEPRT